MEGEAEETEKISSRVCDCVCVCVKQKLYIVNRSTHTGSIESSSERRKFMDHRKAARRCAISSDESLIFQGTRKKV